MDIQHCRQFWLVIECVKLKPGSNSLSLNNHLRVIAQVVLFGRCYADNCSNPLVYYWYPLYSNQSRGCLTRIKTRDFERDWLPRFASDIMDEKAKVGRGRIYVSKHTEWIHKNPETCMRYLRRKEKIERQLIVLPTTKQPKEIYG